MTETLESSEVEQRLENLDIWGFEMGKLATRVEFDGYREAVFFANTVFSLAEKEFHHPKVSVEYGAVEVTVWSHEEEGLTEKDFELAEKIEEAVKEIEWD